MRIKGDVDIGDIIQMLEDELLRPLSISIGPCNRKTTTLMEVDLRVYDEQGER